MSALFAGCGSLPVPTRAGTEQAHIWLCEAVRPLQARDTCRLLALLDHGERQRIYRLQAHGRGDLELLSLGLRRLVLSRYLDCMPSKWTFGRTTYGRPVITNGDETTRALRFSVTHTPGLVAIMVFQGMDGGIDAEYMPPLTRPFLGSASSPHRFYAEWTLKEAVTKGMGLGMALPFRQLKFQKVDQALRLQIVETKRQLAGWSFHQQFLPSAHSLAIALATAQARLGWYRISFQAARAHTWPKA
ncbi:4'-phosphopantetheinyl transferase family protein [Allohahella sp. A8]|uniref:4'-phosphopantetheinyl transferase family protein n=1 Tax=Allohahella sp. A8 TaxID=3141461 RepID=UPI003A7F689A